MRTRWRIARRRRGVGPALGKSRHRVHAPAASGSDEGIWRERIAAGDRAGTCAKRCGPVSACVPAQNRVGRRHLVGRNRAVRESRRHAGGAYRHPARIGMSGHSFGAWTRWRSAASASRWRASFSPSRSRAPHSCIGRIQSVRPGPAAEHPRAGCRSWASITGSRRRCAGTRDHAGNRTQPFRACRHRTNNCSSSTAPTTWCSTAARNP